jgi:beta-mannosidase
MSFTILLLNLNASVVTTEIKNDWLFKQVRGVNWHNAKVPGVVHTDLMANKIIEDPFLGLNERACQWVDKEDWEYKTTFDVTDETFNKNNIQLIFKGLDTYADVYLNDTKLLVAKNMFREWTIDCKSLLKKQGNILRIYFHSPIKIDLPKYNALPYHYPASNDQSENGGLFDKQISPFARKAPYHYGWDWGPRLVTSGIWRPIYIEGWNDARISDVQIFQSDITKKSAKIKAVVEVSSEINGECNVALINADNNKNYNSIKANLTKGINKVSVEFTIQNPELWWTNGLGSQYLYPFKAVLSTGGNVSDSKTVKTGIRSLKLVLENPNGEKTFHFELNGVPVFMKGANYIPSDNFLPRVSNEKYEKVILDARNLNMNMLRIWGGGIYENDIFYELCDKYGILLWHDFMFACSMYPADSAMIENIKTEAIQNVKRIRNHACLALWCGNNEMEVAWNNWGWKSNIEKQSKVYADKVWSEYQLIFNKVLPEVVKEYDPERAYRESSPITISGSGDMHYWDVWHAQEPFTTYAKVIPQFMSEYGFQSFPDFSSVKKYVTNPSDWDIYSETMLLHQRHPRGNQLIKAYMEKDYRMPKDFQSFLYLSHILQADAIKVGEEAHRRNMQKCMGSLYWQLNDCWPVASWSSTDYFGHWKALNYYTKRAYSQTIVSLIEENNKLNAYIVSDKLESRKAELQVKIIDLNGNTIFDKSIAIKTPANSSTISFSESVETLLKGKKRNEVVVYTQLSQNKEIFAENTYYLAKIKDINFEKPEFSKTIKAIEGGFELALATNKAAKGVFLSSDDDDAFFTDNYFDLLPGSIKTIEIKSKLNQADFERSLKIMSIVDSYQETKKE